MKSTIPVISISAESTSPKPTTLLLRTNRPYFYNSWILNNRLRLKNEKLSRRQKFSCHIAFYSFWLCISAGVMLIVIYRFTDECSSTTNQKQFFIKCFRHWLFLISMCITFLGCSGVLFGACRYGRSQNLNFLYEGEGVHQTYLTSTHSLLPRGTPSPSYCHSTSLTNGISTTPSIQTSDRNSACSNTNLIPSPINTPLRQKTPPFNYDELPNEPIPVIISNSSHINNITNKPMYLSSPTTTLL